MSNYIYIVKAIGNLSVDINNRNLNTRLLGLEDKDFFIIQAYTSTFYNFGISSC